MFNKLNLSEKHALVTGANKGIGYGIASLLKVRGARVVATARSENDLARLADEGFVAEYLDVTDIDSIDRLNEKLERLDMMPDILINNAGIGSIALIAKQTSDVWNDTINTNLNSCFEISKRFLPAMSKNRYGRIINISSVLSHFPQKGFSHYSASKAGIEGFTKGVALEGTVAKNLDLSRV
ncbi:SDR family NAD(P)-dependent oxidoreductase [Piscirickettsia salmonis]|uniref:SDR family NAD(P)-dependent oxidoreductase n=1 Tax=Piscirickettsia salmonis TaxID=1238 RepID=UPI0006BDD44B|nr:SDR family NAD(P)-dependent oxidoreductase [Piscirickettsia salmonis]ALA26549.1 3-ketoacyl-ACP reductase [Piscirickettsia salmonis]APS45928.1 hypothetical protein AVI48_15980 [Piscirickettsia salmonis]APS49327.1 hypothetical protein AVI49_16850 [Piscirickettsia salmonis]QGO82420.1 3-oxoacyl-[acyl-carrier-protein] reductase FabG [Piscirickettsia salmonis]QGP24249.1 3-oxoacyl-[acyl-carrier-protein] reductase FabG [Piscirickettsia salmonis]